MTSVKKIKVALLALVAALVIAIPTSAYAGSITIVEKDNAEHTYSAYQIFKGTFDENDQLTNATWGDDVDPTALVANLRAGSSDLDAVKNALKDTATGQDIAEPTAAQVAAAIGKVTTEANYATQRVVADELATIIGNSLKSGATADVLNKANNYTLTDLQDGFYFIKDDSDLTGKTGETLSKNILMTTKDATIDTKREVPSVKKEVQEDSIPNTWGKVGTYEIGQKIPYKITGTLPTDYANYDELYFIQFNDTMSDGLKLLADTVEVKINGTGDAVNEAFDITTGDHSLVVKSDNLRADALTENMVAGDTIVITYECIITEDALIFGTDGYPNTVDMEFSNNPNKQQDGEKGKTPEDKCVVFTFKLDNTKYDKATEETLAGAGFMLKRDADGKFWAGYDADGFVQWLDKDAAKAAGGEKFSDADGKGIDFAGLDANEAYTLVETTVPAGYNQVADMPVVIKTNEIDYQASPVTMTAKEILTQVWLETDTEADDEKKENQAESGTVAQDIYNTSGTNLPSTGGIGTTIFTIVGIALIVAAAAIMVIRRRNAAAIQ